MAVAWVETAYAREEAWAARVSKGGADAAEFSGVLGRSAKAVPAFFKAFAPPLAPYKSVVRAASSCGCSGQACQPPR